MSDKATNNPYGNPDGTPKAGKEADFFAFAREQATHHRNEIPPSDAELIVEEEKALGEQMDSDPEEKK